MSPFQGILLGSRSQFLKNFFTIRCLSLNSSIEDSFPRLCGPSVKKLIAEYDINFSEVPNSGPRGNLLKGDVLSYIENRKLRFIPITTKAPVASFDKVIVKTKSYDDISISSSKKTTAQQTVLSKTTIPHAYINVECIIDKVFEYQHRLKQDGYDVALNDFIVKSVASALRKVPEMNVVSRRGQIEVLKSINIAVNVAAESGFTTAVVQRADSLNVQHVAEQMSSPIDKQGNNNVSLRIVNLGLLGVSEFSAVISSPEVAVLAVGAVNSSYDEPELVQKMRLTLSFNNEIINEQVAASFIHYLREYLENPLNVCLN